MYIIISIIIISINTHCADAQLKVDREPIRAMATEAAKCKRADACAKAKVAQQGGPRPSPQSPVVTSTGDGAAPLTPVAGEVAAGGAAQPEDPEARRPKPSLFNPVIMTFRSRLAYEWTCVAGLT